MRSTCWLALIAAGLLLAGACGDTPTEPLSDPRGLILLVTNEFPSEIYVVRPDGTGLRRLTRDLYNDLYAHWSPDGRHIVFSRSRQPSTGDHAFDITLMNADGGQMRRLLQGGGSAAWPRWSPDGRRIAFQRTDAGVGPRIYVMNADGTDVRLVTAAPQSVAPSWAPDGARLVFVARRPARARQSLYTIRPDGTDEELVAGDSACAGDAYEPQWSPDGTRIVYRCDEVSSGAIHLIRTDGTHPQRLTPGPPLESWKFDGSPVWSPDGGQIVFGSNRFRMNWGPAIMDTLGGNARQLDVPTLPNSNPSAWGAVPGVSSGR
ncbi:MAG: hypothetical protein WC700_01815 [Gemmatimonadaceae bacterium]|jgi:Tol biopolymer transport system component